MIQISKGKIHRPLRIVVDGTEGVGKTTFCSCFPEPLFIDLEHGTDSMDVNRTQTPENWEELIQIVNEVAEEPSVCRTLIIDTGDWAETLCIGYICRKYKQDGIEGFGYGKGYVYLREEFDNLLRALDGVIAAGINVVITAHTKIKKFELPNEQGAFDRYELKMSKNVAPLVREWCDIQLFANFKTYVVDTGNKHHKGTGGTKRVMYASHTASWDAKNRHGLPDEMDFDFRCIEHLFNGTKPGTTGTPWERLQDLMQRDGVTEDELGRFASDKGKAPADKAPSDWEPAFIEGWAIKYWDRIVPLITEARGGAS